MRQALELPRVEKNLLATPMLVALLQTPLRFPLRHLPLYFTATASFSTIASSRNYRDRYHFFETDSDIWSQISADNIGRPMLSGISYHKVRIRISADIQKVMGRCLIYPSNLSQRQIPVAIETKAKEHWFNGSKLSWTFGATVSLWEQTKQQKVSMQNKLRCNSKHYYYCLDPLLQTMDMTYKLQRKFLT